MISDELLKSTKKHEGLRLKPYECTAGKLTIGYGRNIEDVGISKAEAEQMLASDLEQSEKDARSLIPNFDDIGQARQDALIEMAFNLGRTRLSKFRKMIKAIKERKFIIAEMEALDSRWAKQVGKRAQRLAEQLRTNKHH